MSLTIYSNKITCFDTETDALTYTLECEDKGLHRLSLNTFVSQDSLGELFAAIRSGVEMMDREKVVDGAE